MSAKRFGALYVGEAQKETWHGLMNGTALFDKTAMITIVNQTQAEATVCLAYMVDPVATAPAQEDYLLFFKKLAPLETFHYPVLAVSSVARIVVWSQFAGVNFIATGYEDAI